MRALLLAALILVPAARAGAMSFGLGLGAARAGKKAVDKAAGIQNPCQHSTGLSGAPTLTASPLNPANVYLLTPLGNINPPGHTLPTDHMYFYYINLNDPNPNKYNVSYQVYAPADGYVTSVFSGTENGAAQYKVTITNTDTFSIYLDHLMSLDPSIAAAASAPRDCAWIPVHAGQVIGTAGGVIGENAVDLGAINLAVTQPFVNAGHYGYSAHSDSALKYYQGALQATLYGLVNRTTPDYLGSNEKDGIFCYDVAGTAAGNWAAQGSDSNWQNPDSWQQQLSFSYNVQYASEINVAFGGLNGSTPIRPANGLGGWRVQVGATPPQNLTVASGPYGYQLWGWDPNNGNYTGAQPIGLLMVQLLDASTLKVEYFDGNTSASAPFDGNAVLYTR